MLVEQDIQIARLNKLAVYNAQITGVEKGGVRVRRGVRLCAFGHLEVKHEGFE